MAAAPINGEASFDLQLIKNELKTFKSVEADFTIVQLSTSTPFTPPTPSAAKRKRLKPARYDVSSTIAKKKHSSSKPKVVGDLSSKCLGTKGDHTPVETSPGMVQALEIQASLGTDYPSFVKTMVRSHVTSCFWMGLPMPFCKSFLPKNDASMVAEDENGQLYNLKFIAYKSGLSAGWRKFALSHKLLEGDVLIFQLVESCKFKVYIVRSNDLKEVNGALNILNHVVLTEHTTPATITPSPKSKKAINRAKRKRSAPPSRPVDHTSEGVGLELLECSPKPDLSVKEVKTFKDFRIMVNGQCIDSELSEDIRTSYYKLCCDKKEFLHDRLPETMYYKLVAGMIGETVSIAKEIKKCKITTTKEGFEALDNSLKSFEFLGMKVGFLRKRILELASVMLECEDVKRYVEAKEEEKRAECAIKSVEAKLVELKESKRKIGVFLGSLKEKAEVEFMEKVNSPW